MRNSGSKLTIPDDVSQHIQDDFVKRRKEQADLGSTTGSGNEAKLTADDLALWISMARLMALSYGKTELDIDVWNKAVDLDERRKKRLPRT